MTQYSPHNYTTKMRAHTHTQSFVRRLLPTDVCWSSKRRGENNDGTTTFLQYSHTLTQEIEGSTDSNGLTQSLLHCIYNQNLINLWTDYSPVHTSMKQVQWYLPSPQGLGDHMT